MEKNILPIMSQIKNMQSIVKCIHDELTENNENHPDKDNVVYQGLVLHLKQTNNIFDKFNMFLMHVDEPKLNNHFSWKNIV